MPKGEPVLRDLAEDSFLLTEDKQDALEDKSLKQKKRCLCCKKLYTVRDLRKLISDYKEQDQVDKNLAKLNTGKSLLYKTVERGDLRELKEYHERHDFTKRPTMADFRKLYKIKVHPPNLKKLAVKRYATAPNTKKYAAIGTMSANVLELLTKKASGNRDSIKSLSQADLANKLLESFDIRPERPKDNLKGSHMSGNEITLKKTITGKFWSIFSSTEKSPSGSGSRVDARASSTFNVLDRGPFGKMRSSFFGDSASRVATPQPSSTNQLTASKNNVEKKRPSVATKQSSVFGKNSVQTTASSNVSLTVSQKSARNKSPQPSTTALKVKSAESFKSATSINSTPQMSLRSAVSSFSVQSIDTMRTRIVHRFKRNWVTVTTYCENWLATNRKHVFSPKDRKTIERWFVILYTNSNERNDFNSFSTLYVKQTLKLYHVPYQEKDISLLPEYEEELSKRLGKSAETPVVFLQGTKLGNGEVIYYLHSQKKMGIAFRKYIIYSKKRYDDWYYKDNFKYQAEERHINAPLNQYPSLEAVSQGMKAKLDGSGKAKIQEAKEYVKLSKLKWREIANKPYTDCNWFKYALLQAHIRDLFGMMDNVFWCLFFPEKDAQYSKLTKAKMAYDLKMKNSKGSKLSIRRPKE